MSIFFNVHMILNPTLTICSLSSIEHSYNNITQFENIIEFLSDESISDISNKNRINFKLSDNEIFEMDEILNKKQKITNSINNMEHDIELKYFLERQNFRSRIFLIFKLWSIFLFVILILLIVLFSYFFNHNLQALFCNQ